jgi:type VI secretion system protein ImpF
LLNTRRTPTPASDDDYEELANSLYNYGVPDITSLSRDSMDSRSWLRKQLEDALSAFEPRLANVSIDIVEVDGEAHRRELRFVVDATLRMDPTPEHVVFDTVLHFTTGAIDVAGKSDA